MFSWVKPALTPNIFNDQFTFCPTGSTTCALTYFMHHVCKFGETNDYVRVLLINFSMQFDVVSHVILIKKILALDTPTNINNWFISFIPVNIIVRYIYIYIYIYLYIYIFIYIYKM